MSILISFIIFVTGYILGYILAAWKDPDYYQGYEDGYSEAMYHINSRENINN